MKYKFIRSEFIKNGRVIKSKRKIYTDFYCSLTEWDKLRRPERLKLIYQCLGTVDFANKGVEYEYFDEDPDTGEKFINWDQGFYFDKDEAPERVINNIFFEGVIEKITHREVKVNVLYEGNSTLDHVKIVFPNTNMPNIIVLFDFTDHVLYMSESGSGYGLGENLLGEYLLICLNAIYKTLNDKTTDWYEKKLMKFYNKDYDRIYYNLSGTLFYLMMNDSQYSSENCDRPRKYQKYYNVWRWEDIFKPKSSRIENGADIEWK